MQYLALTLLGVVSGILSGYTQDFFPFTPGIVFGIIFGVYFFHKYSLKLLKTLAWVVASSVSYYMAFYLGLFLATASGAGSQVEVTLPYFCAGLLGGLLVSLSFSFLIKRIRFFHILLITGWGGVLALSDTNTEDLINTPLFIVWQTGMVCALYLATRINAESEVVQSEVSPLIERSSLPPQSSSSSLY
jgi:hypothetical protein